MDAHRFDAFVKALSLGAARRGMVAALLGGALASLLAGLESEARDHVNRRQRRHDDRSSGHLAAEKRKQKKKKKKKKGRPPNREEAPPCTAESCPIPPGCSEQVLEECSNALSEALLAAGEPCRPSCEDDANSAACRECLEPIVVALLPDAEACVVASCSSTTRAPASAGARQRAKPRAGQVTAEAWWNRKCEKPTCCYLDYAECLEDARDEWLVCMVPVAVSCYANTLLCPLGIYACAILLQYQSARCVARHGCLKKAGSSWAWGICHPGDICCEQLEFLCDGKCCYQPPGRTQDEMCCNGQCCARNATCCDGECCPFDKCCRGRCCRAGTICRDDECRCPDRRPVCGEGAEAQCCAPDEECCQGGCRFACPSGLVRDPAACVCCYQHQFCGEGAEAHCCSGILEICTKDGCCNPDPQDPTGGIPCCALGVDGCPDEPCCGWEELCCTDETSRGYCCPSEGDCCLVGCCPPGRKCTFCDSGPCCRPENAPPGERCNQCTLPTPGRR